MKPYFVKYLPVEGEAERNITCWGINDCTVFFADNLPDYYCKPCKLFLCSRDIQVGDKYLTAPDYSKERICEDISYDFSECLKVIGEISEEAIWVKEGDEFDEEQVAYCHSMEDNPDEFILIKDWKQWCKEKPLH